jgi:hypothetical protein
VSGQFPSKEHQFRGGERFGKSRPPIGKRRARKLNKEAAVYAAAFGPESEFTGTNVQWLLDVRAGKIKPDSAQLAAAVVLQRYGPDAGEDPRKRVDLSALPDDQRALLAQLLAKVLGFPEKSVRIKNLTIEAAALPAPLPDNAPLEQIDARILELEAELERREKAGSSGL